MDTVVSTPDPATTFRVGELAELLGRVNGRPISLVSQALLEVLEEEAARIRHDQG